MTPPSWRFDIAIEADLIEEVARIVGFDAMPERADAPAAAQFARRAKRRSSERALLELLAARGYQEAITYASSTRRCSSKLFPARAAAALTQSDRGRLAVMRAVAVAGPDQGRAREPAPAAGSRAAVRTSARVSEAADAVEKPMLIAGLAAGSRCRSSGASSATPRRLLRREGGRRRAARADRRQASASIASPAPGLPASRAQRAIVARRQASRLDRRAAPAAGAGTRFHICADRCSNSTYRRRLRLDDAAF